MSIPTVVNGLLHNSFIQGAGLVGLGGTLFAYIRDLPMMLWEKTLDLKRRSIYISKESHADLFTNLLLFIGERAQDKVKSVLVNIKEDSRSEKISVKYTPFDASYKIKINDKVLHISLLKEAPKQEDSNGRAPRPVSSRGAMVSAQSFKDVSSLRLFSYRLSLKELYELIDDLIKEFNKTVHKDDRPKIYRWMPSGYWSSIARTERRTLDSVLLNDPKLGRALKDDIKKFLEDRKWYISVGIPHRRGYLLEGPPGNGKSSLIRAIASELGYHLATINLARVDDEKLEDQLAELPVKSIVVLEDIDAVFGDNNVVEHRIDDESDKMEKADKDVPAPTALMNSIRGLTLSGLLNALDGIRTSEDRIIFMTTNHVERLDAALIRPGRIDVRVHIGRPTRVNIARMFDRFFPNAPREERRRFVHQFDGKEPCMAEIQEKLLLLREHHRDLHKEGSESIQMAHTVVLSASK